MFLDWTKCWSNETAFKYAFRELIYQGLTIGYGCVKYSLDNTPMAYYELVYYSIWNAKVKAFDRTIICSCPDFRRVPCKHLSLLHKVNRTCAIDTGRQYSPELDQWFPPVLKMEM